MAFLDQLQVRALWKHVLKMNNDTIEKIENYGSTSLSATMLSFKSKYYGTWSVNVANISLIGEFTNQDGPSLEDHFLVFIGMNGSLYELPISALGFDLIWTQLADKFKILPRLMLNGETDFASKVLWPEEMRDYVVFDYIDKVPSSFFGRLFSLVGIGEIESRLSSEITQYLEKNEPTSVVK